MNAIGPERLARATAKSGAKLVHYSTDYVFDGELERLYDEFDPPSPQGAYARSKAAGEALQKMLAGGRPSDDVAVAKRPLRAGVLFKDGTVSVEPRQEIPQGHKVALRAVAPGEPVRKYGQVIGFAAGSIGSSESRCQPSRPMS